MTAQTRMSAKGQVVIPKDLRERMDWPPGTELDIEESRDGLLLRPRHRLRQRLTWEEFDRRRPKYDGPPMSQEEMDRAVLREAERRWREKEARNG